MHRLGRFLFLSALAITFGGQLSLAAQQPFTDPANLRGERVKPRDGRELPIDQGSRGLEQMLRKLNTRASLMFIVAHPDDEDGGMLTYCSRGLGARVAMLTLTRGEGGQNAMTGDFEDALGLLRTQELLAADRYLGVDQMFGTEVDFGFSKTKEEAFAKWTHERVLYDAVRAVRLYRPMVIAATFVGGVTDGHGQHQVSGEIAQEVFKAAGDPKVFPELTKEGILPWQPLKVYARVPRGAITSQGLFDYATNKYMPAKFTNYVTGEVTSKAPSADVVVHEGKVDALLSGAGEEPRSYVQFARLGLGQQKSQVGVSERVPPAGVVDVSYHRYGSMLEKGAQKQEEEGFFDGIDTSMAGLAKSAPAMSQPLPALSITPEGILWSLDEEAKQLSDWNSTDERRGDVPHLLGDYLNRINGAIVMLDHLNLPAQSKADVLHELRVKHTQANDALALAVKLEVDATTERADVVQGTVATVQLRTTQLSDGHSSPSLIVRDSNGETVAAELQRSSGADRGAQAHEVSVGTSGRMLTVVTKPPFFRDNIEQAVYKLRDPALRNAAVTPPPLTAWATYVYGGLKVEVGRIVHSGEQPVRVVPPASLTLSAHAQIVADSAASATFSATVSPVPPEGFERKLKIGRGWDTGLAMGDSMVPGKATLQVRKTAKDAGPTLLEASVKLSDGKVLTEGYRPIGYGSLPRTNYFTPATMRVVPANVALPQHRRVAYVAGTGDGVPEALASVGLKPTILSIADLTASKLTEFDTVILGVRTYAARPDLHGAPTQALLEFARSGGNVVLQYQTSEFTAEDAPFPLTLGNAEKVVDETDAVQLIAASAVSLAMPNKLTPADFNGWVEERGHGFLGSWDARYSALTETADAGQAPQRGGWITAHIGKGHWTYCAFALYRQLPEAVPGAYRILMNQLALADEK